MTYCYNCGHMTAGEPLFCGKCGRTYDVKLCPRLHPNPRGAEVCARCGSRELSTPQPKIPLSFEAARNSRPAWPRLVALLRNGTPGHCLAPDCPGPAGIGRHRNAARLSLVDVVEAPRLVSGSDSFFLEKQESTR